MYLVIPSSPSPTLLISPPVSLPSSPPPPTLPPFSSSFSFTLSQYNGQYRCPREVSTIVCVHDVECLEPDCSGHGSCDLGTCSCDKPWMGPICNVLNCSMANCSGKGKCLDGKREREGVRER